MSAAAQRENEKNIKKKVQYGEHKEKWTNHGFEHSCLNARELITVIKNRTNHQTIASFMIKLWNFNNASHEHMFLYD